MVVVSILPHAEFGSNDHREEAPHFIFSDLFLIFLTILEPIYVMYICCNLFPWNKSALVAPTVALIFSFSH